MEFGQPSHQDSLRSRVEQGLGGPDAVEVLLDQVVGRGRSVTIEIDDEERGAGAARCAVWYRDDDGLHLLAMAGRSLVRSLRDALPLWEIASYETLFRYRSWALPTEIVQRPGGWTVTFELSALPA